jgi:hypothetical protein
MKITLFKVGRRGCWFLSLCENFTVWCRPFAGSYWYADPKGFFFCQLPCAITAVIVDLACPVIIGVPTAWRRSSDTIMYVSYFVTLSCNQHCLTCAVERAFSNKLPVSRNGGLVSEVPLRTNSGVLWSNVIIAFGPLLTVKCYNCIWSIAYCQML